MLTFNPGHDAEAHAAQRSSDRRYLKRAGKIIGALLAVVVILQLAPTLPGAKGLGSYAPLHTVLELGSISVSLMVFAICLATPQANRKLYFWWVAAMFLAVGLIDISHTLSYVGMADFVTPNSPDKAIHFWLFARVCSAVGIFGVILIPQHIRATRRDQALLLVLVTVIVATANYLTLIKPDLLPRTFIPGIGLTAFKINFEYVLIFAYLVAAGMILRQCLQHHRSTYSHLLVAASIMAMSEYFFTLYGDITDVYNLVGHFYKIIAYLFICRALFVDSVRLPYRALNESSARLAATVHALPDLLFEIDVDGNYITNHATEQDLLAAPMDNLIGRNLFDVMPAAQAQICLDAIREAEKEGTSTGARICLDVPAGRRHFGLSIAKSDRQIDGKDIYVCLSRDVTEIVDNEQSLAHEARLNASLINLPQQADTLSESAFLAYIGEQAQILTGSTSAFVTEIAHAAEDDDIGNIEARQIAYAGHLPDGQQAHLDLQDMWIEAALNGQPYLVDRASQFVEISSTTASQNLIRVASIPVVDAGKVRLVLTVVNKFETYNQRDIETASLIADRAWQLMLSKRQETAIKRQREELDNFFESSLDLLLIASRDGKIARANQSWYQTMQYAASDIEGHDLVSFIEPTEREKFRDLLSRLKTRHVLDDIETNWIDARGITRCIELRARLVHDQIFLSGRDITERKQQEENLQRLSLAVEQSPIPVLITDLDGQIEYANTNFFEGCDFVLSDVVGKPIRTYLTNEDTGATVYDDMWADLKAGRNWKGEMPHRRNPDDRLSGRIHASLVRGLGGEVIKYLFHIEDITEKVAANARIEQLSTCDQLTGLPNLTHLEHSFVRVTRTSSDPLYLMMLNLDGFRLVNETLGHHSGDKLLHEIAGRMMDVLPRRSWLCRRSGDTFIIVLREGDDAFATKKAEELLATIAVPSKTVTPNVSVSASIGIAAWPRDGLDLTDLMTHAEAAMYQVKESGRNGYRVYSTEMQRDSVMQLSRLRALRLAIDNNELSLNYQPQLDLAKGCITGAEVLLRWHNPELGQISPAEFIPLAESNGLIMPISNWVIRTAMEQISQWRSAGVTDIVFAINLSAVQFNQPEFPTSVKAMADEFDVPPSAIAFELTEAMAMQNPEMALQIMENLHNAGFKLAIDDFGTGYSSMNYLKQFDVDKLKIDQTFVREIGRSGEDQAITAAIIQMADGLGLRTIAEGVETQEQLDFLRESGCAEIQGYLYSKPLPTDEFHAFLREHPYRAELQTGTA